ncbi:MAG: hypothetical protein CMN73_04175 [Sphingomonas sp.]|nr:hypothetical protein [Sphingomonas sp.]
MPEEQIAARKGRYEQDAIVLQDGHVDPITGPRCAVRMLEGPRHGHHLLASTDEVLSQGTIVWRDQITRKARPRDSDEHPQDENAKRLSGEAVPARAGETGIAQTPPQSQDNPND